MATIFHRSIIVIFIVSVFFALVLGTSLGAALAITQNTVNSENFTEFNPALPTRLLDINGEVITEFSSDEKREIITLDQLPPHMVNALITREDQIFYSHPGFSVKAIFRAVIGKLIGKNLGGGSTITQQLAGTLYADRSELTLSRKLRELWWALQLERRYSKNDIIELYMNKMYFGSGTYGVNAASKYYFGHGATEITPAEAAILVIQLSAPASYNPFEYPNRAMERQSEVLRQMVELGYLSKEESDSSFEEYWTSFDYTRINSSAYFMRDDKAPWFSEYVRRELESMLYGSQNLYSDGFTVNTTLNLHNQIAAQDVMERNIAYANNAFQKSSGSRKSEAANMYVPIVDLLALVFDLPQLKISAAQNEAKAYSTYMKELNPVLEVMSIMFGMNDLKIDIVNKANIRQSKDISKNVIEGAFVSIENETGYITALVGGSKFSESNQTIRATQASIQPGSSFKPLYYSAAIDSRKYTAVSVIEDTPIVLYTDAGVPYMPQNFRGEWVGTVQLWSALAQSMNVPSVRILDGIGFDAAINRSAALLGITDPVEIEKKFPRVYPLALGIISVTPLQMVRAFAIFANQGKEVTPFAIRSIADRTGKIFLDPEKEIRLEQKRKGSAIQVISPQNAFIMTDLLRNTVRMGTLANPTKWQNGFPYVDKNGKKYTIPAAGKTGTTQNWADAWAVGFTPYLTTAIWFGFDLPGQSLGLDLTGSTLAGPAWASYMQIAHEGLAMKEFTKPQTGLIQATVCSVSGLILTQACGKQQTTQFFLEGTQPTAACTLHVTMAESKNAAVNTLQKSTLLSGTFRETIEDSSSLTLDLSFLNSTSDSSAENSSQLTTEQTDTYVDETSEFNFFLE